MTERRYTADKARLIGAAAGFLADLLAYTGTKYADETSAKIATVERELFELVTPEHTLVALEMPDGRDIFLAFPVAVAATESDLRDMIADRDRPARIWRVPRLEGEPEDITDAFAGRWILDRMDWGIEEWGEAAHKLPAFLSICFEAEAREVWQTGRRR